MDWLQPFFLQWLQSSINNSLDTNCNGCEIEGKIFFCFILCGFASRFLWVVVLSLKAGYPQAFANELHCQFILHEHFSHFYATVQRTRTVGIQEHSCQKCHLYILLSKACVSPCCRLQMRNLKGFVEHHTIAYQRRGKNKSANTRHWKKKNEN